MADAVGSVCAELAPLLRLVESHVLAEERLHGDDTTVPVLSKGKTDVGRCWIYLRDDRPFGGKAPAAAMFYYSRDRKGEHPQAHLARYAGILQADAFGGYNELYLPGRKPGPIYEAACWAHLWMPPLLQGLLFAFRQYPRLQSSIRPVVAKRPASPALMVNPQVGSQSRVTSSKPGAPNGFMPAPVRPVLPSCSERSSQPRRRIGRRFYCVLKPYDGAVGRKFRHIEVVPKSRARSCSQRRPLRHWRAAAGEGALTIPNCVLSSA